MDDSAVGSTRRTDLFSDTKYTPNLWSQLVRESLLLLGRDYQVFLCRGKAPSPIPAASAPSVTSAPVRFPSTPASLIKKPIHITTTRSPIRAVADSLAADGPFSQAAEVAVVQIPELFRSMESVVHPLVKVPEKNVIKSGELVNWLTTQSNEIWSRTVVRHVPLWIRETVANSMAWWRRERVNKVVEANLPMREVDSVIIRGASFVTWRAVDLNENQCFRN
jgi:nucleoporin NDC1